MATYTATVQLSNGTLSVTRPHPAPESVADAVDSLLYRLTDPSAPMTPPITSIGVTIVTDETPAPTTLQDPLPGLDTDADATPAPPPPEPTQAIPAQAPEPPTATGPLPT